MKVLLAVSLMVAAGSVSAELSAARVEHLRSCNKISEAAAAIMGLRQSGTPMAEVMSFAADDPALEAMVIEAYSRPAGASKAEQDRATNEFRDKAYLDCYRSFQGAVMK